MPATPDFPQTPALDAWEEAFSAGLVATSRTALEPWLAGCVHVARDLPAQ